MYAAAMRSVADVLPARFVTVTGGPRELDPVPFASLTATRPTPAVEAAFAELGPDSVAKILFTSGSTGHPKGVVNTHRMLTSNMAMLGTIWPFLEAEPPVLLDWLPWSHTFGGNHNLNLVLGNAGTLYVDDGRPVPALFDRTVRNLRDVQPTLSFNVPAGYAALVPVLEQDPELAASFFARLRFVFFAASALPQQLWERIEKLAASTGRPVPMTTSWGATETAPAATSAHYHSGRADCIGVPLPGVQIRLAPVGAKHEIRVKGPNVTPGYYRSPEATARAFDEEGFYRTGDAVRLIDPTDPALGVRFDGRIAEDFKLNTGTWVSVGTLRPQLLSASGGLVQDAVLTGQDEAFVGALVWLHPDTARRVAGVDPAGAADNPAALARHPAVLAGLADALGRLAAEAEGSAHVVERAMALTEPASLDTGELTDKGYVNQRAVLERRADAVRELYLDPPGGAVVCRPGRSLDFRDGV
jgi:feruloyl-CoA synthase